MKKSNRLASLPVILHIFYIIDLIGIIVPADIDFRRKTLYLACLPPPLVTLPGMMAVAGIHLYKPELLGVCTVNTIWIAIGFLGQILFSGRFLVQWIVSEKQGKSVVPLAFWILSMFGGIFLLAYAVWRKDPVFILGQSTGFLIYSRNLYLIHRERRRNRVMHEQPV
jgi:lipid-A-disaccharide synthase-like uncharacterized protein